MSFQDRRQCQSRDSTGHSENRALDRSRLRTPSRRSRGCPSDWPYWTGIARGPGRLGSLTLLPDDWAAVYFSGTGGTLGCWAGVAAARSASGRNGLRRGSGLARGLRFSPRKRLCAFAARQQKDIAMHTSIGAVAERPFARRLLAATAGLAFGLAAALPAKAQETIKVGILHSLSGTMAISETTLKDVMLMLIEEQNKKGGLLGKKLEAVVVDPASNWPLFAEKARELITKDKVAVVFGCWTSVSRKSVLPVFKELNSILFYPVQYEGEESERNVFYTGAAPNQQAIPAVDY